MRELSTAVRGLPAVLCVALSLTGCTSLLVSAPAQPRWEDQMRDALRDPDGLGDGSGGTPGSMQLVTPATQRDWVVYAACTGTDTLHLTVHAGTAQARETDITCGTTARLPVEASSDASVSLTVENPDRYDTHALWYATINTATWTPQD